jgi:gliding motility associated protien GldN
MNLGGDMKKVLFLVFISIFIFGIKLNTKAQVLEGPPRDAIYDRTTISQVDPIPYCNIREADVIWSRRIWRTIDMREKMNQPFYYPTQPQNGWKNFAQIIWDGLREGTITAYSAKLEVDDQFLVPLTFKELMDQLKRTEKKTLSRPDNQDDKFDTTIVTDFDPAEVNKLRIKEDWVFDRQRSVQEVRILGICLVKPYISPTTGEAMGDQPICWVYFPECRNLLVKNEQFNLKNGVAGRLSYDDVFMKRMFASYIYKFENVYDRTINEYETGVGALLEADKAKRNLFEFEQNIWEY